MNDCASSTLELNLAAVLPTVVHSAGITDPITTMFTDVFHDSASIGLGLDGYSRCYEARVYSMVLSSCSQTIFEGCLSTTNIISSDTLQTQIK